MNPEPVKPTLKEFLMVLLLILVSAIHGLVYQARQFNKPFPDPGSWAYNIQTWWYDVQHGGHATGDFNIDPDKEPKPTDPEQDSEMAKDIAWHNMMSEIFIDPDPSGEADKNEHHSSPQSDILDEPAYIRRDRSISFIADNTVIGSEPEADGDVEPPVSPNIRTNVSGDDI